MHDQFVMELYGGEILADSYNEYRYAARWLVQEARPRARHVEVKAGGMSFYIALSAF